MVKKFEIPNKELKLEFFRSTGPGGQRVNKVSTGVRVRWNIDKSKALTEEQKERVKKKYIQKITEKKELVVESQKFRSQLKNRKLVIERINKLVKEALKKIKIRKRIKVPKYKKEERLKEKKRLSEKKKLRKISKEEIFYLF